MSGNKIIATGDGMDFVLRADQVYQVRSGWTCDSIGFPMGARWLCSLENWKQYRAVFSVRHQSLTNTNMKLKLRQVKTIDVTAKEWFDKANGNSYFAAVIVLNYGRPNAETLHLPFQYGYGDHYVEMACAEIQRRCPRANFERPLWLQCNKRGITLRTNKIENCTKREVTAFGQA